MDDHHKTSTHGQDRPLDLPRRAPLRLDPDEFSEEMKAFDFSEDQARDFLQAIWDILVMCADLELGVDPVSLICGQNAQSGDTAPPARPDMVKSMSDTQTTNNEKEEL